MRVLAASIVIGSLMLIGALSAAAGQPTVAPGSAAPIRLADNGNATADRDTYLRTARDEMREWQRKLHDFKMKAEATESVAGKAAEADLNRAWTKAEAASRRLQTASAKDWESARISFDKAFRDLADAWHKVYPEDK